MLFGKPKPGTRAYREKMAERINGKRIRYVTERIDGIDTVVGKNGSLAILDGDFILHVPEKTLLRCSTGDLDAWELLSKDGVVLTGTSPDGTVHTYTAYYVYYR